MTEILIWLALVVIPSIIGSTIVKGFVDSYLKKMSVDVFEHLKQASWATWKFYLKVCFVFCLITMLVLSLVPNLYNNFYSVILISIGNQRAKEKKFNDAIFYYNKALKPIEKEFSKAYYARGIAQIDQARQGLDFRTVEAGMQDLDKSMLLDKDLMYNPEISQVYSIMANEYFSEAMQILRTTNRNDREYENKINQSLLLMTKALDYYAFISKNDKNYGTNFEQIKKQEMKINKKMGDIFFYRFHNYTNAITCYITAKTIANKLIEQETFVHEISLNLGKIYAYRALFLMEEAALCMADDDRNSHIKEALEYCDRVQKETGYIEALVNKENRDFCRKIFSNEYKNDLYKSLFYCCIVRGMSKYHLCGWYKPKSVLMNEHFIKAFNYSNRMTCQNTQTLIARSYNALYGNGEMNKDKNKSISTRRAFLNGF